VLAQTMIPRTGMMDAENPMPMRYEVDSEEIKGWFVCRCADTSRRTLAH
jgi:hypothetical protein